MTNHIPLIPQNIVDTMSYQADSIVSKQILKSEKLEVMFFAVGQGQDFAEHTTTREALVHIVDGEGEFFITDAWYDFKPGDYFSMPADCVHALRSKTDYKFLLYLF